MPMELWHSTVGCRKPEYEGYIRCIPTKARNQLIGVGVYRGWVGVGEEAYGMVGIGLGLGLVLVN